MMHVFMSAPTAVIIMMVMAMPEPSARVSGFAVSMAGVCGGILFQSADNLFQKLRQLLPFIPGKRRKEGVRAFPPAVSDGRGGTLAGDGNNPIALVLFIAFTLNETALLQFAQNFTQGSRTDIEHFLKRTLIHGFSVLKQGEHMHLRVFRMPVMVVGAGHKPDCPMEEYGQIFTACSGCVVIFVHGSHLWIPHTRVPGRKRERSAGNACRIEDIGGKSPRESRRRRWRAYPDRPVLASVHARAHTRVRVSDGARNDEISQILQTYNSPYVVWKVPSFEE
jgi:hypothetical protein